MTRERAKQLAELFTAYLNLLNIKIEMKHF